MLPLASLVGNSLSKKKYISKKENKFPPVRLAKLLATFFSHDINILLLLSSFNSGTNTQNSWLNV